MGDKCRHPALSPTAIPDFQASTKAGRCSRHTAPAYWMHNILWVPLTEGHETGGSFSVIVANVDRGPPTPVLRRDAALADTNAFAWGRMDVYLSLVY
jgi:hypothetical protein